MSQGRPEGEFAILIPELKHWNDGRGIAVDDWIGCVGNFEHAIGYSSLFWPEFTVFEDCVLFADASEDAFRGFMDQTKGDKTAVEAVMNHWHIVDIFSDDAPDPTKEQVQYLGRVLKEMWQAKLWRDFPDREVVVSFPEDAVEDLTDYEITVFQERNRAV